MHTHIYGSAITPFGVLAPNGTLRSFIEKYVSLAIDH